MEGRSLIAAAVMKGIQTKKRKTTRKLSLDCQTGQSKGCYFFPFFSPFVLRVHFCSLLSTSTEFKYN